MQQHTDSNSAAAAHTILNGPHEVSSSPAIEAMKFNSCGSVNVLLKTKLGNTMFVVSFLVPWTQQGMRTNPRLIGQAKMVDLVFP